MVAWLAAGVATCLWALLLLALAVATRNPDIDPGPATSELGPESPAVVDLITGGWQLSDEASAATLLDLAGKGAVQIEEIGPELSLVRVRRDPGDLSPYERLVYEHVSSLARDGVVATGALAEGSRNLGRWWKSFRRKVVDEARAAGLSRTRWSKAQALLLTVAAAVPAVAVGIAVTVTDDKHEGGLGAGVITMAALVAWMGKLNGERGTKLGAERASYWMGVREHFAAGQFSEQPAAAVTIWGRHLAYAAALGLTPRAVKSLPVSTPADDKKAWSDYGGMWHVVNVRYPRRLLWGRAPWPTIGRALLAALFVGMWTWIALLVLSAFDLWPDGLVQPVAWGAAAVAAAIPLAYAITDMTTKATVEGQVIRLRRVQTGSTDGHPRYAYWCAIDDGRARDVKAYGLTEMIWSGLGEGDLVRLAVGRRLGWITGAEVLQRSRLRDAAVYDDTGEHTVDAPINLGEVLSVSARTASRSRQNGDGIVPAELVTPEDLRRALGIVAEPAPYQDRLPAPSWLDIRSCRYTAPHGVVVDVHAATGKRSRYLMVLGHMLTRVQGQPIQGVGTSAMLYPGLVSAQTDRGTFAINVSSPAGPPPPDPLIDLARTAAARLG
ncbi:DUF2207 domain-containing protein [Streptosporangiaceae bacterium NEAU-GS5]|nr:DUF2207 domain-containing protein [Streptosporangiaceae bacterium NEAU-GS5]